MLVIGLISRDSEREARALSHRTLALIPGPSPGGRREEKSVDTVLAFTVGEGLDRRESSFARGLLILSRVAHSRGMSFVANGPAGWKRAVSVAAFPLSSLSLWERAGVRARVSGATAR
jgi:hypothetical protein